MGVAEVARIDRASADTFKALVEQLRGSGSATEDAARGTDRDAYVSFQGSSVGLATLEQLPGLTGGGATELIGHITQGSGLDLGHVTPLAASVHVDPDADRTKLKAFRVAIGLLHAPVPLLDLGGGRDLRLESVVLDLSCLPAGGNTHTVTAALDIELRLGQERLIGFVSLPDGRLECELVLGEEAARQPGVHAKVVPEGVHLPGGSWQTASGEEPARVLLSGSLRGKVFTLAVDLPGERGDMAGIKVADLLLSLSLPGLEVSFEGVARMSETSVRLLARVGDGGWQVNACAAPVELAHVKGWAHDTFHVGLPEVIGDVRLCVVGIEAGSAGISLDCVGEVPLDHTSGRGVSFSLHAGHTPGGGTDFNASAALPVNRGQDIASLAGNVTGGDLSLAWADGDGVTLSPSALGIPVEFPDFLTPVLTSLALKRTKGDAGTTWMVAGSTRSTAFVLASMPRQPPAT
ncbi:hypothetical protein [Streptomyces sp. XD-27]|uniref:hypothetical protein n=1 Tax=Streptomyces sp. XD-27 TaxID=3062779 RepID=UPI0026F41E8A|nr:hypothetical protein [Streptomyces sp. XD-27]WKX74061.1 hypothetical protein Q3Y56_33110 [Streptomyces sp. XD-27]